MSEKAIVVADANGDDGGGSVATIIGAASGGAGGVAIGFSILYSVGVPGFSGELYTIVPKPP